MADYTAIRDGLAARLETIDAFLTVHATVPGRIIAPAAVVVPGRPVAVYHDSMIGNGGSLTVFNFELVCAVQSMTEEFAQDALDDLITGPDSVPAAIETDPTLGGAATTCQVRQAVDYGVIAYADTEFIGARFLVEVYAR
ncbi:MAG: hypothetical protein GY911_10500 [Actinomycetales bacterium]|nr:hypothetical protein [Actinomycetales bacterium]